jgi:hypothetical protein
LVSLSFSPSLLSFFVCLFLSLSFSLSHTLCHSLALFVCFFVSFFFSSYTFVFPVSNFSLNWKFFIFSSSRNSRRERELFQVPESMWRDYFGTYFHEIFGNRRDTAEKLWCLMHSPK